MKSQSFTNLQLELLKLYSLELSEGELKDVQRLLARYFADKASDQMDELWEEKAWSNKTMTEWLKGEQDEPSA